MCILRSVYFQSVFHSFPHTRQHISAAFWTFLSNGPGFEIFTLPQIIKLRGVKTGPLGAHGIATFPILSTHAAAYLSSLLDFSFKWARFRIFYITPNNKIKRGQNGASSGPWNRNFTHFYPYTQQHISAAFKWARFRIFTIAQWIKLSGVKTGSLGAYGFATSLSIFFKDMLHWTISETKLRSVDTLVVVHEIVWKGKSKANQQLMSFFLYILK